MKRFAPAKNINTTKVYCQIMKSFRENSNDELQKLDNEEKTICHRWLMRAVGQERWRRNQMVPQRR